MVICVAPGVCATVVVYAYEMNTCRPVSAAANVYTPATTEYWPVAGALATLVMGTPLALRTPMSCDHVPPLGMVGVIWYGDAGISEPVTSKLYANLPVDSVWPKNSDEIVRPFTCANLALTPTLPLPRPTSTGNWFWPYSCLVSNDSSIEISCETASWMGVPLAMVLP